MIVDWDIYAIRSDIDKIARAEADWMYDGFNCWARKKELYELYWYLEDKLENCSNYSCEEAFLEKRREQKIISKLERNNENNR